MKLDRMIKLAALRSLVASDFNIVYAAENLGIGKTTLYRWLKEWGVKNIGGEALLRSEQVRRKTAILNMIDSLERQ